MRFRFVLGEVWTGLRRNLTMTIALIVTIAVSLALFGAGLLVRQQVAQMKALELPWRKQWRLVCR